MTNDRAHRLLVRAWAHPTVRRLAETRAGKWLASRRRVRPLLDTFHERSSERRTHPLRTVMHRPPPVARRNTAAAPAAPAPVTRFIVLSEGRSGSTLLVHSLGRRWPEIRALGEEFSRDHPSWSSFDDSLRRAYLTLDGHPIIGCKVLVGQTTPRELTELLELDDMHVIVLRRRDLLRRHVSEEIARKTDQWTLRSTEPASSADSRAVTVDTARLHRRLMLSRRYFEDLDVMTQDLPRLEIWYEDLESDLDGQLRRVATFLGAGAPANEAPPLLARQNPEPLRELVRNLDEVEEFLASTGFADLIGGSGPDLPAASEPMETPSTPTPTQIAVVHAAFSSADRGPGPSIDPLLAVIDSMEGDPQARRLATTIRRRLRGRGTSSASLDRLHRDSTVLNLRLLDLLPKVIDALDAAGIPSILVGGTAIAVNASGTGSAHPMDRLELAVRPADEVRAIESVLAAGWRRSIDGRLTHGDLVLVLDHCERDLIDRTMAPPTDRLGDALVSIVDGPGSDRFRRIVDALFLMDPDGDGIDRTLIDRLVPASRNQQQTITEAVAILDRIIEPLVLTDRTNTDRGLP